MAKRDAAYNWYWVRIQILVTRQQCVPQIIDVLAYSPRYILRGLDERITAPYRVEATMYVGTGEDYYLCRRQEEWVFDQAQRQILWPQLQRARQETLLEFLDTGPGV